MSIIEQIKAEIGRLKATNPSEYNYQNAEGYVWALDDILSFLSTLESEKPMNLEEEINRYLREECSNDDEPGVHEIAEHFAQWGAKHLKK